MPMPPLPVDRGDVWLADLGMAAKVRPCLVLSVTPGAADRVLFTLANILSGTCYQEYAGKNLTLPVDEQFDPSAVALELHRKQSGL
jgi:mRNA-degrading endonuclease toxin of MazEF toxin-antitoxin module